MEMRIGRVRGQLDARNPSASAMITDEDIVQALASNDDHVGQAVQALELQAQAMVQLNTEAAEATAMADAAYPGAPPVPGSYPSANATYMAYPVAAASSIQKQWRSRGNLYPDAPRNEAPTGPAGFPLPIATAQPIPDHSQQLSIATAVGMPVAAASAGPLGGSMKPKVWGVHPDKACDMSDQDPIVGWRYHRRGTDYDLNEEWFDRLQPHEKLAFVKIAPPGFAPDLAPGELFFDLHTAKPSYIPFDEYLARDGSGRLVLRRVNEACLRAGIWEGFEGCPVVRLQDLDGALPASSPGKELSFDGVEPDELDELLHNARTLRIVLDTSAVPTLNGHASHVNEISIGKRGAPRRKPINIYPCLPEPFSKMGDVQQARRIEGQKACTSIMFCMSVLVSLVFLLLCYPELRRNLLFLPAKCEPYADAQLRPEVRPYRHCYTSCIGCTPAFSITPCTFKLGMHYAINEYDLSAMMYIAGSCSGSSCCARKVCQTCSRTEQRCSRRRSRRLLQADDAFAVASDGGEEEEEEQEEYQLIDSWDEEVVGDWKEVEGGELDEDDLDADLDADLGGIGDGSEAIGSAAISVAAGDELPTWRAAAEQPWKVGADAHSSARRRQLRSSRSSSRSSRSSSSRTCYTTRVNYECNCRCVNLVHRKACSVHCLPYWRAFVPVRVSVDRYETAGVFYADDDPRAVSSAKTDWQAMLSVNASTSAQRSAGNDRADALGAIEGGDAAVYSPYSDTAARAQGYSVNLGWSRLVTLVYNHGPSRSGAIYEMERPEHIIGTVQECYYDPDWNTRSALLPASQVAFASEMGYTTWKWLLLVLLLVPLIMCCGTFGYARYLGLERIEKIML